MIVFEMIFECLLLVDLCSTGCERYRSCDPLPAAISGDAKGNERHGESEIG